MKIDDLKTLEKVLALCIKKGVSTIEIDNLKIEISAPPKRTRSIKPQLQELEPINLEPTMEQLLNWSVRATGEPSEGN